MGMVTANHAPGRLLASTKAATSSNRAAGMNRNMPSEARDRQAVGLWGVRPSCAVESGVIMTDRDWNDDSDYDDAAQRAEQATRFGWAAIAGTVGVLGCTLIATAVVCVVTVIGCLYVVMALDS